MPLGSLFTVDFLSEGIKADAAWLAPSDPALEARLRALVDAFPRAGEPNEAQTEKDLIHPVLEALGWHLVVQETAGKKGRGDVPDAMLCGDAAAKGAAYAAKGGDRYRHALAILESKRWERALDRGPDVDGVPSIQILRYLSLADVLSERQAQWGILTNGRLWRLYWQGAKSRSEEFLEIDLADLLGYPPAQPDLLSPSVGGDDARRRHWLRVFVLLFGRNAFRPDGDGRTLHQRALDRSRDWEARVAAGLGTVIFQQVFPTLVDALARGDPLRSTALTPGYLREVRDAALTLLYRLLFLLYAEDRDLLPVRDPRYDDYSLKRTVRDPVGERIDRRDAFSSRIGPFYDRCRNLFAIVDQGDRALGIPPYDGGLFERERASLLDRVVLPDAVFAPLIDGLSRREEDGRRLRINYRDLSVQQLGTIYERLLEFEPVAAGEHSLHTGGVTGSGSGTEGDTRLVDIQPNAFARKATGSYYTPESLVRLILDRTVGPLVAERRAAFRDRAATLKGGAGPAAERRAALEALDPASALLDLRICDPAMGSGHFLVSLVDYLADAVLESVAEARVAADWAQYESPLLGRIAVIRDGIHARAEREGWIVGPGQLDDRLIVRRMVLKRVVHGVDKNPMAVELAKLALWLHTFTVGAPLSFLDHHLRCGDSLFGEAVRGAMDTLKARGGIFINSVAQRAAGAAAGMARIEATTDADIVEAESSADTFAEVERDTEPLRTLLDALHAERWLAVLDRAPKRDPRAEAERAGKPADPAALAAWDRAMAFRALFDGSFGPDVIGILEGRAPPHPPDVANQPSLLGNGAARQTDMLRARAVDAHAFAALAPLLAELRGVAAEQRFLHWEAAFPNLWRDWPSAAPPGGFDAVIGNPPWDRLKLQEVEWFAARRPEIALQQRAADRTALIAALKRDGDPVYRDYERARDAAEAAARVARTAIHDDGPPPFPLLSGGDTNLYSLFVERAQRLLAPCGIAGLVVPSGIAADKTASAFFASVASTGRLGALLDFENRRPGAEPFFPAVDGRFKFCAFVVGGRERSFAAALCGFFLSDPAQADDPARTVPLSAADFAAVNPNTGTAPIFRARRDAEITLGIYRRLPVLVDRRTDPPTRAWPVRYVTMFHMTNDSHLFRTRAELEAEGFYAVAGDRLRRGAEEYVPLYEGKMVQAFDHRAASVVINAANLHRPAQEEPATAEQKADPAWLPQPQFYVSTAAVEWPTTGSWAIGFKDVASPTNVRSMIAAAIPRSGSGNTLPLLSSTEVAPSALALLLGNLNAVAFDYVARQKIQSVHLNWYIVEQLPVVPDGAYDRAFGPSTAREIVQTEVLRLTYTAHDMAPFARDLGHDGPPFAWDEDERRHARARLDAVYFHLYGLGWADAEHVLSTFPIIEREDRASFGRFLTRDLIRGYYHAFAAGDVTSRVA